ncbi:hypothetical protein EDB19DRAFT_1773736 [Suillus lakei]|nr:hypothetical protein EDB19DRAFT_1773736 [Suillus lakei]
MNLSLRDIVAITCPLLAISSMLAGLMVPNPAFTKRIPLFGCHRIHYFHCQRSPFPWIALFSMMAWSVMFSRIRLSICPVGWWSRWPWTMGGPLPAPQLGELVVTVRLS